jgi:hypothetical protein
VGVRVRVAFPQRERGVHEHDSDVLLAPLFCMGYIYATRRRQILSIALTTMIICFVLIARSIPQPWRGILDAGVVVGLSLGVLSIAYFLIISSNDPARLTISAEVPGDS